MCDFTLVCRYPKGKKDQLDSTDLGCQKLEGFEG